MCVYCKCVSSLVVFLYKLYVSVYEMYRKCVVVMYILCLCHVHFIIRSSAFIGRWAVLGCINTKC